jgi:hypothetical protein
VRKLIVIAVLGCVWKKFADRKADASVGEPARRGSQQG